MSEIRSQATPARDELAADIFRSAANIDQGLYEHEAQELANRLLAAGWSKPRTVNSAAELDALPELSVVLVGGQLAAQKDLAWFATGGEEPVEFNEEAWKAGIVVLFTPGDAG